MTQETTAASPPEEVRYAQLRDEEGNPVFQNIDLQLAEMAVTCLPETLSETQRHFAFLSFAYCHLQTRKGHLLFPTREITTLVFSDSPQMELPSVVEIESLFNQLDSSFHQNDQNPFYWESPEVLYVRNFWNTENETAKKIVRRTFCEDTSAPKVPLQLDLAPSLTEAQLKAATLPLSHPLVLISGGPGTGKTYTVFQTIRAILHQQPQARIRLLAPTGKAVARIQESIRGGISQQVELNESALAHVDASTIHRFLRQHEDASSRYQAYPRPQEPLHFVIVDEASMIDLQLLHRLLQALPLETHLILMGDVSQLASVQPGAVFADTFESCRQTKGHGIPTIELQNPFRFKDNPVLAELCDSIRKGNVSNSLDLLQQKTPGTSVELIDPVDSESIDRRLKEWVKTHILDQVGSGDPKEAIKNYERSMILCVQNEGPYGVNTLNRTLNRTCAHHLHNRISESEQKAFWKPIMVRKNDYALHLYNGDVGVLQQSISTEKITQPLACFQAVDGTFLYQPEHLLPDYTDAFAMTVHKSQGSEADHVLLLIPGQVNPLLSRELLYTAVSRAKKTLTIVGKPDIFRHCIENPVRRESQLSLRIDQLLRNRTEH